MEIEEPVMQGLLLFPPQGVLGQLKKTWHKRYCQLFKASKSGIGRLEIWDSRDDYLNQQSSLRIITLEACIKIGPSNQSKVFAVVTKTNVYHFGCYTEVECYDWINAFQQVAFKDDQSSQTLEEDNDLYCTSGEGVFSVKLVETEASKRCRLEPKNYTLIIAAVDMKLMDGDTILFVWPYQSIRKYGYRDGKFTFDAGRKCESGEGSFKLQHSNQQEIYRCISSKMQSMKKLLRGDVAGGVSIHSSSTVSSIDLNDAQYHAALSMEAGSRSPLPPTPNLSAENFMDVDFSVGSLNLQRPLVTSTSSSNISLDTMPLIRPPPPIIKPKPAKPPRKYVFSGLPDKKTIACDLTSVPSSSRGIYRKYNAYSSPEVSRKSRYRGHEEKHYNDSDNNERHPYDIVEVRSNAWKTHGMDTIPHTERINKPLSSMHEMKHDKTDQTEGKIQRIVINDNKDINEVNVNFTDDDDDIEHNNDHSDKNDGHVDCHYDNNDSHDDKDDDNHNNNQGNEDSLGIQHEQTKNDNKIDDFQYKSITSESINSSKITAASPYIHNNIATTSDSTANYDKLQHIGSLYKLDNNPGYKTPSQTVSITSKRVTSPPNNALLNSVDESNLSWNDYDIVEDLSNIRLADDSSRGYGVIKKKKNPSGPQHKIYNNSEYAIVSKPKRV